LQRYFSYYCSRRQDKDDKDSFQDSNQALRQLKPHSKDAHKHYQRQLPKFLQL